MLNTLVSILVIVTNMLTISVCLGLIVASRLYIDAIDLQKTHWLLTTFWVAVGLTAGSYILGQTSTLQNYAKITDLLQTLFFAGSTTIFLAAAIMTSEIKNRIGWLLLRLIPLIAAALLLLLVIDALRTEESTSLPYVVYGTLLFCSAAAVAFIWRANASSNMTLRWPALLLLAASASYLVMITDQPVITTMLVAATIIMMAINFIKQQVVIPISELNAEFQLTNTKLRAAISELIDEQTRADKLNQSLQSTSLYKSELLTAMNHELRTPLNAIVGYSEMLLDDIYGSINDKQRERVSIINQSGTDLLTLIDAILDLSSIDADNMTLDTRQVSLEEILQSVTSSFEQQIQEKPIAFESHVIEIPYPIYGDPIRIKQIVSNLLSNALKFTKMGRIDLSIFNCTVMQGQSEQIKLPVLGWLSDGDWVIISVKDTGIGIAPQDQASVFDEFRKLNALDDRSDGAGLGLAITKKLVTQHNGHIWLDSKQNEGSTFYVAFPAIARLTTEAN